MKGTQHFSGNLPKSSGTGQFARRALRCGGFVGVWPGGAMGCSYEWSDAVLGIAKLVERGGSVACLGRGTGSGGCGLRFACGRIPPPRPGRLGWGRLATGYAREARASPRGYSPAPRGGETRERRLGTGVFWGALWGLESLCASAPGFRPGVLKVVRLARSFSASWRQHLGLHRRTGCTCSCCSG